MTSPKKPVLINQIQNQIVASWVALKTIEDTMAQAVQGANAFLGRY